MQELIERLEKAGIGGDALDEEIALALGWTRRWAHDEEIGDYQEWVSPSGEGWGILASACSPLGRSTSSIDAALTLVPGGCAWQVGCEIDFTPVARVFGQDIHADEFAATPAIALCIAALKARQAMSEQPSGY